MDPTTLCSTDPRYHFLLMDCLVNLGLRGNDSRLVLHRGFAEKQTKADGAAFRKTEGNEELYGEPIENHSNVHKLAALCGERKPDYFFTQSCNQSTCKGLRRLRNWVTNPIAHERIAKRYGLDIDEAQRILRISSAPYVQRSWEIVANLWMKYIIYSKEEPLHKIEYAWYRKEFQDQNGNPSHIHAILKTCIDTTTDEGRNIVLDKIRGSLNDLIRYNEIKGIVNNGMSNSTDFLHDLLLQAKTYLSHKCDNRCQIPRTNEDGETEYVCKVAHNFLLSMNPAEHRVQEVHTKHSDLAMAHLHDLGLATTDPDSPHPILHPLLKSQRHILICVKNVSKFSPTNGKLFCMYPSSSNLQYTTGFTICTYLTSYVSEMDRAAIVLFQPKAGKHNHDTIDLLHKTTNNTKINSVKTENKKKGIQAAVWPTSNPHGMLNSRAWLFVGKKYSTVHSHANLRKRI